jgi:hypothetical protein
LEFPAAAKFAVNFSSSIIKSFQFCPESAGFGRDAGNAAANSGNYLHKQFSAQHLYLLLYAAHKPEQGFGSEFWFSLWRPFHANSTLTQKVP